MKLLPEHTQNVTPCLRAGVLILLHKGEVVYFTDSQNIFRDMAEAMEIDVVPCDAFSYIVCEPEQAEWLVKQMEEIYK